MKGRHSLGFRRDAEAGTEDPTVPVVVKMALSMKDELLALAKERRQKLPDFLRGLFEREIEEARDLQQLPRASGE